MKPNTSKSLSGLMISAAVLILGITLVGAGRELSVELRPAMGVAQNDTSSSASSETKSDSSPKSSPSPSPSANPDPSPSLNSDTSSKGEKDKSTEKPKPIYLDFQSNPPGARVEIGLQFNGWEIIPGTGRTTCITPCRAIKLNPTDVAILPNGSAHLIARLEKHHFAPHIDVIDLGKVDRTEALKALDTEKVSRTITLQHCDWFATKENESVCEATSTTKQSNPDLEERSEQEKSSSGKGS